MKRGARRHGRFMMASSKVVEGLGEAVTIGGDPVTGEAATIGGDPVTGDAVTIGGDPVTGEAVAPGVLPFSPAEIDGVVNEIFGGAQ